MNPSPPSPPPHHRQPLITAVVWQLFGDDNNGTTTTPDFDLKQNDHYYCLDDTTTTTANDIDSTTVTTVTTTVTTTAYLSRMIRHYYFYETLPQYNNVVIMGGILLLLLLVWMTMEILFFIYFHWVLIPRANQPYREVLLRANTNTNSNSGSGSVCSSSSSRSSNNSTASTTTTATTNSSASSPSPSPSFGRTIKNPYREPYHIHKHLLLRRIIYRIWNDTIRSNCDHTDNNDVHSNTNDNRSSSSHTDTSNLHHHDDDDDAVKRTHYLLRLQQQQQQHHYDPIVLREVVTEYIMSWFPHPHPRHPRTTSITNPTTTKPLSPLKVTPVSSTTTSIPTTSIRLNEQGSNVSSISTTTNTPNEQHEPEDQATETTDTASNSSGGGSSNSSSSDMEEEEDSVSFTNEPTTDHSHTSIITTNKKKHSNRSNTTTTTTTNVSNSMTDTDHHRGNNDYYWTIPHISKSQMDDFLAWSMFNKHMTHQMTNADHIELQKCYMELQTQVQLVFHHHDNDNNDSDTNKNKNNSNYDNNTNYITDGNDPQPLPSQPPLLHRKDTSLSSPSSSSSFWNDWSIIRRTTKATTTSTTTMPQPSVVDTATTPRRLCFEYVQAWHRPLFIYGIVYMIRTVLTKIVLQYWYGFQRVQSQNVPGVTGWYRPSSIRPQPPQQQSRIPMIFFHGIAPGGVFFYVPMLLFGNGSDIFTNDRCCLIIDNYSIAGTIQAQFDAIVSEQQMVRGIEDLIHIYIPNPTTTPLAVCGHSFGSCIVSWLFNHGTVQLRQQIQLCVLLDPVTILLSDPNVMNNFLYSHKVLCCIRMFASSELFTEYYLRHHFSWYNSELWLDEILLPPSLNNNSKKTTNDNNNNLHVVIGLSECDEIVDAPKVKRHIDLFQQRHAKMMCNSSSKSQKPQQQQRIRTIYWKNAGHANCLKSPTKWQDIRRAMNECEQSILTQRKQHQE